MRVLCDRRGASVPSVRRCRRRGGGEGVEGCATQRASRDVPGGGGAERDSRGVRVVLARTRRGNDVDDFVSVYTLGKAHARARLAVESGTTRSALGGCATLRRRIAGQRCWMGREKLYNAVNAIEGVAGQVNDMTAASSKTREEIVEALSAYPPRSTI